MDETLAAQSSDTLVTAWPGCFAGPGTASTCSLVFVGVHFRANPDSANQFLRYDSVSPELC
jgi:hypothetical protein